MKALFPGFTVIVAAILAVVPAGLNWKEDVLVLTDDCHSVLPFPKVNPYVPSFLFFHVSAPYYKIRIGSDVGRLVAPSSYSMSAFRALFAPEDSITLLYGGPRTKVRLRLIWRSRITAFIARSHGIVQPAAGSLILSDLDTNLSLQFES